MIRDPDPCFFQWPGYEHVDWARSIEINAQGPITRAQLALNVCRIIGHFAEVCFFFRRLCTGC
jgi:hypothetical protein